MDVVTAQLRNDLKKIDYVTGKEIRRIAFAGHRIRFNLKDHKKENKRQIYLDDIVKNNATKANFERIFREYQLKDDPTGKSYSPADKNLFVCMWLFTTVPIGIYFLYLLSSYLSRRTKCESN